MVIRAPPPPQGEFHVPHYIVNSSTYHHSDYDDGIHSHSFEIGKYTDAVAIPVKLK